MANNLGLKIANYEQHYRVLKSELQSASENLTKILAETNKAISDFHDSNEKKKQALEALTKAGADRLLVLDKIKKENEVLENKKKELINQDHILSQIIYSQTEEEKKIPVIKRELSIIQGEIKKEEDKIYSIKLQKEEILKELREAGKIRDGVQREYLLQKALELKDIESLIKEKEGLRNELKNIQEEINDKRESLSGTKGNILNMIEQLKIKEKDLTILSNRLRNEYEKMGRSKIPIKELEVPKYYEKEK